MLSESPYFGLVLFWFPSYLGSDAFNGLSPISPARTEGHESKDPSIFIPLDTQCLEP